jgi:hypothetical protein
MGGSSLTEIPTFHCFVKEKNFLSFTLHPSSFLFYTRYEINAHELYDANGRKICGGYYFLIRKIKASGLKVE